MSREEKYFNKKTKFLKHPNTYRPNIYNKEYISILGRTVKNEMKTNFTNYQRV